MAKRPRSAAQQAASRANGRRSRGPKTVEGKARSRRNSLQHGLRAEVLDLLPLEAGGPNETLVSGVRAELEPKDVIEAELVDSIAMALWRLRRARELEAELSRAQGKGRALSPLAASLVKREHGGTPLALILRYRNQAVGELDRLLRLLEGRRSSGDQASAAAKPEGRAAAKRPTRFRLATGLEAIATASGTANDNLASGAVAGEPGPTSLS